MKVKMKNNAVVLTTTWLSLSLVLLCSHPFIILVLLEFVWVG